MIAVMSEMRRPVLYITCAVSLGVCISYCLHLEIGHIFILCALPLLIAVLTNKKVLCILICATFAGGLWLNIYQSRPDPVMEFAGREVSIRGEIISAEQKEKDFFRFVIKTSQKSKVQISLYKKMPAYKDCVGRAVTVSGEISLPERRRNPGCFDYRLYLMSRGINTAISDASEVRVGKIVSPLSNALWHLRMNFEEDAQKYMSENSAAVAVAMLFGDKSKLSEETYEEFRHNGTAHVLAVSGLHVGIVYGFVCMLMGSRRRPLGNACVAVLLLAYAALAGFSPSVVRAVIMILLHMLALVSHRRYDLMSAAAVASLLMIINNPMAIFDSAFQMSFLAVLSLSVGLNLFKEKEIPRAVREFILPSAIIQTAMLPYMAYTFNYISVSGYLANIPVIFLAGLIVPAGLISVFLNMFLPGFSEIGFHMLDFICALLDRCNSFTYADGMAGMNAVSPPTIFISCFYALAFFFTSDTFRVWKSRHKAREIFCILTLLLILSFFASSATGDGFEKSDITFVDVGQGSCIHIKTPRGKNILIDGGGNEHYDVGKKTLMPYLLKNGCASVDLALVTHLDTDHYGGIASLAKEGMIEKLGTWRGNESLEEKIKKETCLLAEDIVYLGKGDDIRVEEDVSISILWPEEGEAGEEYAEESQNENSLVIMIEYAGVKALATGDIGEDTEEAIWESNAGRPEALACDIVAVPHHGSRYSSSDYLVDELAGLQYAVVQVGKNNYGHPTHEAMTKYRRIGARVLRNDRKGAIGFCLRIGKLKPIVMF